MSQPPLPEPPHAEADNVNASLVALIGIFAAVGLFLIVVLLQAWFYSWSETERARKTVPTDDPATAYGRMVLEQRAQLNSYHWADLNHQTRAIPIEQAMNLVAAEMATTQPKPPSEVYHGSKTP